MGKPVVVATDALLRPSGPLRICPSCAVPAAWRFDKKGRPYHYCGNCGTRVFLYSVTGLIGLELARDAVLRMGPTRHRNMVNRIVTRRVASLSRSRPFQAAVR